MTALGVPARAMPLKSLLLIASLVASLNLHCSSDVSVDSIRADAVRGGSELGTLPPFDLLDLAGNSVTDRDLEGKVALVNFWATWCLPCKVEMPWFVDFQRKYKDRDFTVIAISLDEDGWDPVRRFAEDYELNFPVLLGDDSVAEDFGGVMALPTTLIIDRSGAVVSRHMGLVSRSTYEGEIEGLL